MSKSKDKNQNNTSNLKSIKDVSKNFKTKAQLEAHIGDLMVLIDGQRREIQRLETDLEASSNKVTHLEKILEHSVPQLGAGGEIELDEVTIARMQLNKIGKLASTRELTNEEARRFEIFSRVVQNDAKIEKPNKPLGVLRDVTPAKMLEMAKSKTKKDI